MELRFPSHLPFHKFIQILLVHRQFAVEQSRLFAVVYVNELVTIDDRWNSLLPIIYGHAETSAASPQITWKTMLRRLRNDSSHPFDALNSVFPSCLAYLRAFSWTIVPLRGNFCARAVWNHSQQATIHVLVACLLQLAFAIESVVLIFFWVSNWPVFGQSSDNWRQDLPHFAVLIKST